MNNEDVKISIAIDGFSSCGKSTLAKALANKLHYHYLDTGAMYRAVTLFAMKEGLVKDGLLYVDEISRRLDEIDITFERNKETGRSDVVLNGKNVEKEIRSQDVASLVSPVSAIQAVRRKLHKSQRAMAEKKGVVMDGRDIGTVVMPDAELKIFMTADPEVRVLRRFEEQRAKGQDLSMEQVRENLKTRDLIDSTRVEDPLRQADDAIVLDNSELTPDEQLQMALGWALKAIEDKKNATAP